jgi:hypothetical protein
MLMLVILGIRAHGIAETKEEARTRLVPGFSEAPQ